MTWRRGAGAVLLALAVPAMAGADERASRGDDRTRGGPQTEQNAPPDRPPRDSIWNGLLIGAGVGALVGLIPDHYDDCEPCHDPLYGSIVFGAGIGVVIDLLRRPAPAAPAPARVVSPLHLRVEVGRRTGVAATVRWR